MEKKLPPEAIIGRDFSEKKFYTGVKFPCPYCSADVEMGETEEGRPFATHTVPTCKGFDDSNDIDAFINMMRDARMKIAPRTFD